MHSTIKHGENKYNGKIYNVVTVSSNGEQLQQAVDRNI
jgi:hypothetical protein